MKGLMIKDYYCMKNTLANIIFVSFCTILLAVMFTLSVKYGNIAKYVLHNPQSEFSTEDFLSFYQYVIWIILLIPMAFITNILDCFTEDDRSGFRKTLFSMPVSEKEIAGARYLSLMTYSVVGGSASILSALLVSLSDEQIYLKDLLSVIFTFWGIMLALSAIALPLVYMWGAKFRDLILTGILFVFFIGAFTFGKNKIHQITETAQAVDPTKSLSLLLDRIHDFLTQNGFIMFFISILLLICSYILSVCILKRKRGAAI